MLNLLVETRILHGCLKEFLFESYSSRDRASGDMLLNMLECCTLLDWNTAGCDEDFEQKNEIAVAQMEGL